MRVRLLFFILFVPALLSYACSRTVITSNELVSLASLKDADLLFIAQGEPNAITEVTQGVEGLKIDHVGIYIRIDTAEFVLEARPPAVMLTSLRDFKNRVKAQDPHARIIVGRVVTEFNSEVSIRRAMAYIGRKYDFLYLPDDKELYCSELVQKSFVDAQGKLLFNPIPMTFRDKTGKIPEVFVNMYKQKNMPVPEGEPGSNPGELSRRPQLQIGY